MRSVHTNDRGTFNTAVYEVSHRWPLSAVEGSLPAFVESLFPQAWGESVSAFDLRLRGDRVTYFLLTSHAEEEFPGEVKRLLSDYDPDVQVDTVCAVPGPSFSAAASDPEDSPAPAPADANESQQLLAAEQEKEAALGEEELDIAPAEAEDGAAAEAAAEAEDEDATEADDAALAEDSSSLPEASPNEEDLEREEDVDTAGVEEADEIAPGEQDELIAPAEEAEHVADVQEDGDYAGMTAEEIELAQRYVPPQGHEDYAIAPRMRAALQRHNEEALVKLKRYAEGIFTAEEVAKTRRHSGEMPEEQLRAEMQREAEQELERIGRVGTVTVDELVQCRETIAKSRDAIDARRQEGTLALNQATDAKTYDADLAFVDRLIDQAKAKGPKRGRKLVAAKKRS